MQKRGFHRWAWLVVFLLGGLLMLYGGAQDVTLYVAPGLAPVSSWRVVLPAVGLICGLVVLASAGFNLVWGWRLRRATGALERKLAGHVALVSVVAMVADWVSGYYGFGSLMALLAALWLARRG